MIIFINLENKFFDKIFNAKKFNISCNNDIDYIRK